MELGSSDVKSSQEMGDSVGCESVPILACSDSRVKQTEHHQPHRRETLIVL